MKTILYSRRKFFLRFLGSGTVLIAGGAVLSGCGSNATSEAGKKAGPKPNDCDDLSGVSKGELEKREKFGYIKKTQLADSYCGNCGMFVPNQQNKDCGTCLLFQGPVHTTGYCIQYVAKQ